MFRLPILLFVTLCACGPNKNNFAQSLVELSCERTEECAKGVFDSLYTSVDDCIARSEANANDVADCYAGHCKFDRSNASQCLDRVKAADCSEIVDASAYSDCEQVWSECDNESDTCLGTDDTAGG